MSANPYYPVTTISDSSQLADDEWGLTMPSVQYSKSSRSKRFKSLCEGMKGLPRCAVIIFVSVCVLILICVIIAVAASNNERHPTGNEPLRVYHTLGLNFYPAPEDKSIVIRYKSQKFKGDEAILKSMDTVLEPYEHLHQLNEEKFAQCTQANNPGNKTCKFPIVKFGRECTRSRDYGYGVNPPCIFIQLDVPPNMTIGPITQGSPLWEVAEKDLAVNEHKEDPTVVPFSCDGATEEDRDTIARTMIVPKDKKYIRYFPGNTFPSYFYRQRDLKLEFIKPAVMLQFTSLLHNHLTHIKCTAWGQVYHLDGMMVDHTLLETTFAIYIEA